MDHRIFKEFWRNIVGDGKFPILWFGWHKALLQFNRIFIEFPILCVDFHRICNIHSCLSEKILFTKYEELNADDSNELFVRAIPTVL